jgi:SH3-like domain-containing protein
MNRLGLAAVFAAAVLTSACRSAFAPPPVARVGEAPKPQVAATVRQESALRSGPHERAAVLGTLAPGAAVTASDEVVRGFRRVRTADGRSGYVAQETIDLGAASPAAQAAPAAQPAVNAAP